MDKQKLLLMKYSENNVHVLKSRKKFLEHRELRVKGRSENSFFSHLQNAVLKSLSTIRR